MIGVLKADDDYRRATDDERALVANGCGPGGILGWFVADSLLGLSIEKACSIHDWQYARGVTTEDRRDADHDFLENMNRIIDLSNKSQLVTTVRKILALSYYSVVRLFGWLSFRT